MTHLMNITPDILSSGIQAASHQLYVPVAESPVRRWFRDQYGAQWIGDPEGLQSRFSVVLKKQNPSPRQVVQPVASHQTKRYSSTKLPHGDKTDRQINQSSRYMEVNVWDFQLPSKTTVLHHRPRSHF